MLILEFRYILVGHHKPYLQVHRHDLKFLEYNRTREASEGISVLWFTVYEMVHHYV